MRTRAHDWFDEATGRAAYGIQVFIGGRWLNLAENGTPCIYATEAERDAKRKEYRKKEEGPHPVQRFHVMAKTYAEARTWVHEQAVARIDFHWIHDEHTINRLRGMRGQTLHILESAKSCPDYCIVVNIARAIGLNMVWYDE